MSTFRIMKQKDPPSGSKRRLLDKIDELQEELESQRQQFDEKNQMI